MTIEEMKEYTNNLDAYSAEEVDKLTLMTDEELVEYQNELENDDGDNLSTWDHIRATITFRAKVFLSSPFSSDN